MMGVGLLYHLAEAGWTDCILVEKGELTSGSTWHAAGQCPSFIANYNLAKIHQYSNTLYQKLEEMTGQPTGWHGCGGIRLATRREEVDYFRLVEGISANIGFRMQIISPEEIKKINPNTAVEALTPDFNGELTDVEKVVDSGVDVFAQNIETVKRLTHPVRDPRAGYQQTIDVLAHAKQHRAEVLTKTSLMLGLGERDEEIAATMHDLYAAGVDILTLGQYLRPTPNHLAIERYVTPDEFAAYRREGLDIGFLEVVAGPLVRSSYRAERVLQKNNVGIAV